MSFGKLIKIWWHIFFALPTVLVVYMKYERSLTLCHFSILQQFSFRFAKNQRLHRISINYLHTSKKSEFGGKGITTTKGRIKEQEKAITYSRKKDLRERNHTSKKKKLWRVFPFFLPFNPLLSKNRLKPKKWKTPEVICQREIVACSERTWSGSVIKYRARRK